MMKRNFFNSAPSNIRSFYANWQIQYLYLYQPVYRDPTLVAQTFTPMQIANRSYLWSRLAGSPAPLELPDFRNNTDWPSPNPTLSAFSPFFIPYPDQWYLIPKMLERKPARKYKVRKSYWTGVSRPRRNLS